MVRDELGDSGGRPSRRDVLRAIGAGGALALAGCDGDGGTPTAEDDTVTFLLATSQSGEYGNVGIHERNGFELAVRHLNAGDDEQKGYVEAFEGLDAGGVLGREVQTVVEDTENTGSTAEAIADRRLPGDGAAMVTGGIGGDVAYALSEKANEHGVPYMAGLSPVPDLTGSRCAETTFREMFHAEEIVAALGPVLTEELGSNQTFFQITSQGVEGEVLQTAVTDFFSAAETANWQPTGQESVRPGAADLEETVGSAARSRSDVVFLNLYGLDAINAVLAARDQLDAETTIVVPLIDYSLPLAVGADVAGIYGTVPWDVAVSDSSLTRQFDQDYLFYYGQSAGGQAQTAAGTAHVTYVQTILYALAAERAGSFATDAVVAELDGMSYAVGMGQQQFRSCDHQSTRPVPVVRGIESPVAGRNRLELVTLNANALGPCDESPAADCSL